MELLAILLSGLWVIRATVRAVLTDGRGHTPEVRSHESWTAEDRPSVPYTWAQY